MRYCKAVPQRTPYIYHKLFADQVAVPLAAYLYDDQHFEVMH